MASTTAYSYLNVTATIDRRAVIGLWEGDDAIMVEPGADIGSMVVGANGDSIFSQSANRSATITLKLQHTSPTHRFLSQKLKTQRAGQLSGFSFTVNDRGSNEGGGADKCFISQAPTDSKGENASERTWVIVTGDWTPNVPFEV